MAGDWNFTFAIRPYQRQNTVQRINLKRHPDQRLHYVSKYRFVRQILEDYRKLISSDVAVYVQFDARYASARMIKYIQRQGWHETCRVRANRTFRQCPVPKSYVTLY